MHSKLPVLPLLISILFILGIFAQDVKSRVNFSKDIKLQSAERDEQLKNSRQGRFFGLLSLLAGLSLYDSDWTDSHETGGINIKTKFQATPYGIGWPYGPRYVPVLIPASYLSTLKFVPDQKPTGNQQIVNVDSPMKKESYNEVSKSASQITPERFTRQAVELETNATVEEIHENMMNQSESSTEAMQKVTEAPQTQSEAQETPQSVQNTTPMAMTSGNITVNEVQKPPNLPPNGTSSYYRKFPPKGTYNVDSVSFTTLYPPLGTPPPDYGAFQASPEDESSLRRAPGSFQPLIQVPIFWRNR